MRTLTFACLPAASAAGGYSGAWAWISFGAFVTTFVSFGGGGASGAGGASSARATAQSAHNTTTTRSMARSIRPQFGRYRCLGLWLLPQMREQLVEHAVHRALERFAPVVRQVLTLE